MKPTAYSYIRFSQLSQSKGGSLDRQMLSAEEYARKEGLTLSTLKVQDLGVSAFKGKNSKEGALKEFMDAALAGTIEKGSYLLIEDFDRLTRLPATQGFAVLQKILEAGITLVTLKNGAKYTAESIDKDFMQLMQVLFDMSRGFGESDRKSYLLGKAWRKKKAQAVNELKPLGNNAPLWLKLSKDGSEYEKIPERVAVVNRIFEMSADGYGFGAIASALNKDGIPSFKGATWGTTSINRLLCNRSVLGEYRPRTGSGKPSERIPTGEVVEGFYPVVVEPSLFERVREAVDGRFIHRATKQSINFNIWQGVAVCRLCGSALYLLNKGKPPKGHTYLVCSNSKVGLCTARGIREEAAENVFAHLLAATGDMSLVAEDVARIGKELQAARGRLSAEQSRFDLMREAQSENPSVAGFGLLAELEGKVAGTKLEIERLAGVLAANSVIDREHFFAKLDLVSRSGRNQANALLKRLEIKVTVIKVGKVIDYGVYRQERLILQLTDEGGDVKERIYSPDIAIRLHDQGHIEKLEVEGLFKSQKQYPKFGEPKSEAVQAVTSDSHVNYADGGYGHDEASFHGVHEDDKDEDDVGDY